MKINLTIWTSNSGIIHGQFGWHEAMARALHYVSRREAVGFLFVPSREAK